MFSKTVKKNEHDAENQVLNLCLLALSGAGCKAFRNNTGTLLDRTGRPVKFGLCVGSCDIIGLTPEGLFLGVECKTAIGQPTDAQVRFIAMIVAMGGRAGVARSPEQAVAIALARPFPPQSG
jgi:hypothetical protein